MVKDRKGDFRVISIEVMTETVKPEETSIGKCTLSEENNKNDMLWGRQMHLGG